MNTNASTAAVIGIGAIGTILAYFGLQYVSEDEVSTEVESVAENVNNSDNLYNEVENDTVTVNTESEKVENIETVENNEPVKTTENVKTTDDTNQSIENDKAKINKKGIKLEVTEAISNKKTDENKWSEYWEGEYKNQDKQTKDIVVDEL
jgi:hypothetical protein